jgi:hypothetical protein
MRRSLEVLLAHARAAAELRALRAAATFLAGINDVIDVTPVRARRNLAVLRP